MFIGTRHGDAAARRFADKPKLQEIRLVNVLNRRSFFSCGCGKRVQTDRTAAEFNDNRIQQSSVNIVKPQLIHFKSVQRHCRNGSGNAPVSFNLGEITYALQKPVCDSGRAARTQGDLVRSRIVDFYV